MQVVVGRILFEYKLLKRTTIGLLWRTPILWCVTGKIKASWPTVLQHCFFRLKDSSGWQQVFTSPHIESLIERLAVNAKMGSSETSKMVAISYGSQVRLWGISDTGARTNVGKLLFIAALPSCT